MAGSWGVALLLATHSGGAADASLQIVPGAEPESQMTDPVLEAARANNPTARFLPLLHAMARISSGSGVGATPIRDSLRVALPNGGGTLLVDVARC